MATAILSLGILVLFVVIFVGMIAYVVSSAKKTGTFSGIIDEQARAAGFEPAIAGSLYFTRIEGDPPPQGLVITRLQDHSFRYLGKFGPMTATLIEGQEPVFAGPQIGTIPIPPEIADPCLTQHLLTQKNNPVVYRAMSALSQGFDFHWGSNGLRIKWNGPGPDNPSQTEANGELVIETAGRTYHFVPENVSHFTGFAHSPDIFTIKGDRNGTPISLMKDPRKYLYNSLGKTPYFLSPQCDFVDCAVTALVICFHLTYLILPWTRQPSRASGVR